MDRHLLMRLGLLLLGVCIIPACEDKTVIQGGGPAPAPTPSLLWSSAGGPEGGSVYAYAIDPVTPANQYAGTWGGGLYKSTDSGTTWAEANTGLENVFVSARSLRE